MALDWKDTGGSQFFITLSPQPHLDARYTVFGQVLDGMAVVDALEPWDVIESVRVWDGKQWIAGPGKLIAARLTAGPRGRTRKRGHDACPLDLAVAEGRPTASWRSSWRPSWPSSPSLPCVIPPFRLDVCGLGCRATRSRLPPGTLRRRAGPPASCARRGADARILWVRGKTGQFDSNRPEGHRRPTSSSRSSWPPSWPPSLPSSPLFLLRDLTPPDGGHPTALLLVA